MRYALLIAPSTNRVYAEASLALTVAELRIFSTRLAHPVTELGEVKLGGVRYIGFTADLSAADLDLVSNLSTGYALFEQVGELLRPVELTPLANFDDDLITIPKYSGKTNELFTRLLLNVTVLASTRDLRTPLTVLDPLAGRATTLNQALVYGYSGLGIELDGKDVEIYASFLKTYLQRKRIKHRSEFNPVRRDRKIVARRFDATIGEQSLTLLHADTTRARDFFKPQCTDVIVADAPYGVAHGAKADGSLARSPLALLSAATPVWAQLLRPGGAIGLAFNTHTAKRAEVAEILVGSGLTVLDGPGYDDLEHRVDQAILRDVIVARR